MTVAPDAILCGFCLRLYKRLLTPFNVILLFIMWCFVILVAILTLSFRPLPVYAHQLNGVKTSSNKLNDVHTFEIGAGSHLEKEDDVRDKPVMQHSNRPKPTTPLQLLSASQQQNPDAKFIHSGARPLPGSQAFRSHPPTTQELLKDQPAILKRRQPVQSLKIYLNNKQQEQKYLHHKLVQSFGKRYTNSPEYKRLLKQCSEDKRRPGQALTLNIAPYLWPQKELCRGKTDILIAVHTRPTNFANRQLIRETYGSLRNVNGKRVVVAFFIGDSGNRDIQKRINEEAKENRDVVLRDFKENYRNMTIKHLAVMEWVMDYCNNVKYLVKADDDVFVNIFQVLTFIDTFPPSGFYCSRTVGAKPMRKNGKWKLTFEDYPKKRFPPYCMGYGYLMRAVHAKSLYWCSVFSKFLWIDDVLVGGILPEKMKISIEGFLNGYGVTYMLPSHASNRIADFMFLMGPRNTVVPSTFRRLWRAALQHSY